MTVLQWTQRVCFLLLMGTYLVFPYALAHKGKAHDAPQVTEKPGAKSEEKKREEVLKEINRSYIKNIKPIFSKKCFDCHSQSTQFPWYYPVPGIKQLIDSDIAESKKHMDMSNDFPFPGHGSPEEDLEAIQEVAKDGSMPPFRYWIMHWDKQLSSEDQRSILEWTDFSLEKLKALPSPKPGPSTPPEAETQK